RRREEDATHRELPVGQVRDLQPGRRSARLGELQLAGDQPDLVPAGPEGQALLVLQPRFGGPLVLRRAEVEGGDPAEGRANRVSLGVVYAAHQLDGRLA